MDLTTPEYVRSLVPDLDAAQLAALPGRITAASCLIQNWCSRQIGFQAGIDELIDAEASGEILLRESPVIGIQRVAGNPTSALYITNTSGTTQRARAQLNAAAPGGLIANSITLESKSIGVTQSKTISFATAGLNTVGDLAAYISAQPGTWQATAEADFANWGVDDLVAGQGWQSSRQQAASFLVFGTEQDYRADLRSGILALDWSDWDDPFRSARFGPAFTMDSAGGRIGEERQGIRVTYDAGYDPVPDDVQGAVAELVKATFERLEVSSVFQSEKTAVWSYTLRQFGEVIGDMPPAVMQVVNFYRSNT